MVNMLEIQSPDPTDTGERVLTGLKRLRDEYEDEIPEEIVHSNSLRSKIKARKGWFCSVSGRLEYLIYLGLIKDPTVFKKLARGVDIFTSERFKKTGTDQKNRYYLRKSSNKLSAGRSLASSRQIQHLQRIS